MKKVIDFFTIQALSYKKPINIGDIGIYHDYLIVDNHRDTYNPVKYNWFAKIKVLNVYQSLVEVEVIEITISESVNQDIKNIIESSMLKYLKSNDITWQVK